MYTYNANAFYHSFKDFYIRQVTNPYRLFGYVVLCVFLILQYLHEIKYSPDSVVRFIFLGLFVCLIIFSEILVFNNSKKIWNKTLYFIVDEGDFSGDNYIKISSINLIELLKNDIVLIHSDRDFTVAPTAIAFKMRSSKIEFLNRMKSINSEIANNIIERGFIHTSFKRLKLDN